MRVDRKATQWMWRQTIWGTAIAAILFAGLIVYFLTLPTPDYQSAKFAGLLLILVPIALGGAYLIRRVIERLAD
jgi:hypothetical protein